MSKIYIRNKGMNKTVIQQNNQNIVDEMNWDADYDGKKATVDLDVNNKHVHFELDNNDLAEILNVPSINEPLDKRLLYDFPTSSKKVREITLPTEELFFEPISIRKEELNDYYSLPLQKSNRKKLKISELVKSPKMVLLSPEPGVPLFAQKQTHSKTKHRKSSKKSKTKRSTKF